MVWYNQKYLKTIFFVIIGIGIKSICQYFFGAEDTSIEKLILGLDYSFYLGCILGSWIIIIFQDNWNIKFSDYYIDKSILRKYNLEKPMRKSK